MPILILAGLGALGVGAGAKMAGDGVESASGGLTKLVLAGAVAGGLYLYFKGE